MLQVVNLPHIGYTTTSNFILSSAIKIFFSESFNNYPNVQDATQTETNISKISSTQIGLSYVGVKTSFPKTEAGLYFMTKLAKKQYKSWVLVHFLKLSMPKHSANIQNDRSRHIDNIARNKAYSCKMNVSYCWEKLQQVWFQLQTWPGSRNNCWY